MKVKRNYGLYNIKKGKIHIGDKLFHGKEYNYSRYLCGVVTSRENKRIYGNKVIESDIVICKTCLKKYYKLGKE